ncbi:MAG: MATE family efflux transporter [Pseudomonadota bacterium]
MRVTSNDILKGPINPTLRRMTGPMVVGILFTMLFQAVDTFFISKLGTVELAAISFTFPVTFTMLNLVIGLGIAMSIIVGQAIGQGRMNKAARITTESMILTIAVTFALAMAGLASIDVLFTWLGADAQTLTFIHDYLDVWFLFSLLLAVPLLCNSAIRATGDTKWPSILMMISGFVNVVLDPVFIFGFGPVPAMGMAGAAWATVASWVFASSAALYLLVVREKLLVFSLPPLSEAMDVWRQLVRLAAPICLANMLGPIAAGALTAIVAQFGQSAVAAFGVGARVEAFTLVVAFAITAALSPYMSQNLGAGQTTRALRALRNCAKFVLVFQLVVYALQFLAAPMIAGWFSTDPEVLPVAVLYMRIMPIGVVCYAVIVVINTAFNAHQQSGRTLSMSLLRVGLFVVPLSWLGARVYDLVGLFGGAVVGSLLGLFAVLMSYRQMLAQNQAARSRGASS